MQLSGSFRVLDVWQGEDQKGKQRASATLNDSQDGGQFKVNFPDGFVPDEFGIDQVVKDLKVKPLSTKFGLMLILQGFKK